jgi:DNA-binding cell septation regulator SpoVG
MSISNKAGKTKAFASIIFDDELEVDVRIMEGINDIWVAYPSNKNNGAWQNIFKILNPKLKKRVEEHLIKLYSYEKSKKNNN